MSTLKLADFGSQTMTSTLPFDLSLGMPIPAFRVDDRCVIAAMRAQALLSLVPDPVAAEKEARKKNDFDPRLREYQALRTETQRMFEGRKAANARRYSDYILQGLAGERKFVLPVITLYTPDRLEVTDLGNGTVAAMLPYGNFLVCIDGETQRRALGLAASRDARVRELQVKVVLHHGRDLAWARQAFHDLNILGVKPNAAVSVSMDTEDIATRLTRVVADSSPVLEGRLNLVRRSLRRTDDELLTISALRTGIVTTLLGGEGLQLGMRPIGALPDGIAQADVEDDVIAAWVGVLELLEDELARERRPDTVVSAPVILAGIGMLINRTMPDELRTRGAERIDLEEALDRLQGIDWSRSEKWDGICGKWSRRARAKGDVYHVLAIGSPKELGHKVAEALGNPTSERGKAIRA